MARPASKHPTGLELQILKVLWDRGPLMVRDVRRALADMGTSAYLVVGGLDHETSESSEKHERVICRTNLYLKPGLIVDFPWRMDQTFLAEGFLPKIDQQAHSIISVLQVE